VDWRSVQNSTRLFNQEFCVLTQASLQLALSLWILLLSFAMTVEKKTSLRVLYTINSSPQYILARSHTRVPVSLIPSNDNQNDNAPSDKSQASNPLYANVLLKTCLDTICRSSPELTHDSTRDFSLYVLDPLESNSAPAPVHINNANGESSSKCNTRVVDQPRGVAVGLGLMSWALTADDSDAMTVVGTLVKQSNGQEALEVIFALREVCRVISNLCHLTIWCSRQWR
jgi:hypothetical protein